MVKLSSNATCWVFLKHTVLSEAQLANSGYKQLHCLKKKFKAPQWKTWNEMECSLYKWSSCINLMLINIFQQSQHIPLLFCWSYSSCIWWLCHQQWVVAKFFLLPWAISAHRTSSKLWWFDSELLPSSSTNSSKVTFSCLPHRAGI